MKYLFILSLFGCTSVFGQNIKYDKWVEPGYFRGYNVTNGSPKTLQDFIDFKNYGGNLLQIGTGGFIAEDSPYDIIQSNIDGTDFLVNFCRQTGIYYTIAVRSGPGAYDTYLESQGYTGESRIWNSGNITEQQLYANMLKMITERYSADTLFVGLNLVVEPRPKVRYIPANNSNLYKYFLENVYHIYMNEVYQFFINEIRSANQELPLLIENFAYSTPELFPAYELNDPYIIYDAHLYQPKEYTNANVMFSVSYPGTYWNITYLSQQYFDASFMRETVLSRLRAFQETTQTPIILGEFGILLPQKGVTAYLTDVFNICKDYGWHFALWNWRDGQTMNWNIERFNTNSNSELEPWNAVLSYFNSPPKPVLLEPPDSSLVNSYPTFSWKHMTAYTYFDAEVSDGSRVLGKVTNAHDSLWTYNGIQLQEGRTYYWRVRAKNPGGKPENESPWTEQRVFYFQNPIQTAGMEQSARIYKFNLYDNYPNPFNPKSKIKYETAKTGMVNLTIYNSLGKNVVTLVNQILNPGEHEVEFDGTNLPSGIYFYRLITSNFTETKKMVLVK